MQLVNFFYDRKDWQQLNAYIPIMVKKRSQLKQAVVKMVQETMKFLEKTPNEKVKLELLDTLRTVTEGKVRTER